MGKLFFLVQINWIFSEKFDNIKLRIRIIKQDIKIKRLDRFDKEPSGNSRTEKDSTWKKNPNL